MTQTTEASSRSPEPQEVLRVAIEYFLRDVAVSLPGQIEEWDPDLQKATVKPLVQRLLATEEGEELVEALPVITGVPVIFPRAGGFYITFPVKPGDFCQLIFNHYSVDVYKSGTGEDSNPQDFRMHDLSDAVAYMGFHPFSKAITDYDPDAIIIGKENSIQIRIAGDKIELGERGATDAVTKDSSNQIELQRAFDNAQAVLTYAIALSGVWASGVPVPNDGGAAVQTAQDLAVTAITPPTLQPKQDTKSTIVTLKE